jgi:hypothetical protein
MSPEQLEGKEADARSDLWALGCVLYEMATGKRAFEGKSQASVDLIDHGSEPAPISQLSPMTPPALDRLVSAMLAATCSGHACSAHDVKLQLVWIAKAVRRRTAEDGRHGAQSVSAAYGSALWCWRSPVRSPVACFQARRRRPDHAHGDRGAPGARVQISGDDAGPLGSFSGWKRLVFSAVGGGGGRALDPAPRGARGASGWPAPTAPRILLVSRWCFGCFLRDGPVEASDLAQGSGDHAGQRASILRAAGHRQRAA